MTEKTCEQITKLRKPFIPEEVREKDLYKSIVTNFSEVVKKVAHLMGQQSVPFWSPRYEGHMCTDLTMPSLLGYFMAMLYNPNNVALEASPFTTYAEIKAGEQLCEMFGYNIDPNISPQGWGHITADGTIANLESIWVGMYANTALRSCRVLNWIFNSPKSEILPIVALPCHQKGKVAVPGWQVLD